MKNRHTAMGMDTTGAPLTEMAMLSRVRATPGAILPSRMPANDAQQHPDGKVAFENTGHFAFGGIVFSDTH